MRRRGVLPILLVPALSLGCAPDRNPTGNDDASSGTGDTASGDTEDDETDDDPSASAGTTQPSTTGVDESSSGGMPNDGPVLARGITLAGVYANQGVEVALLQDGTYLDPASRNAQLVQNRNTLVRAPWVLEEGFAPREIRAELTLVLPNGDEEVAGKNFMVSGPSDDADLDTNIWFVLPSELIVPGVEFQLELFETAPGHESEPEPAITAYPPEPEPFGVIDSEMVLKTVLVPVHHNLGVQCPVAPTFDEQTLQPFIDELFMQNPAQEVVIEVHEPVQYTNDLGSFNGLLGFLAELREQEGADPAYYYYGVVRPCDGGPDGVGGQAISIPSYPEIGNAWTRVAVGRWNTGSIISTAHTFVHEIGHTQGRRHVACSGSEGGPDPAYPYDGGDIGVWGFGVIDFSYHTPTNAKDYMTYCGNTWVSDWGWQSVLPFIEEITSWDTMDAAPVPTRELLVGLVDPATGDETWFVTQGSATGRVVTGSETMTIESGDGISTAVQATVGPMGDGDAYAIAVELPEALELPRAKIVRESGAPIEQVRARGELVELRRD
jgi:hypothetical protein